MNDSNNHQQQKNVFYFYQSSDGQAIYLHHINVHMLVRCYGSLEMCPETIQGRIVEIETLSMTEDWRNRLRYLGHIPVSKQFQIMEISLTEPEIDSSILEEFRGSWDIFMLISYGFIYWFLFKNVLTSELVVVAERIEKKDAENWKYNERKMPSGVGRKTNQSCGLTHRFIFQDSAPALRIYQRLGKTLLRICHLPVLNVGFSKMLDCRLPRLVLYIVSCGM